MVSRNNMRMLIVQAAALVIAMHAFLLSRLRMVHNKHPRITYAPMSQRDKERQTNLNKMYNCNDVECVNMLRMRRAPFFELCNLLRTRELLKDSIHSYVEEQVAMFLHVVGHNQRFRVIHQSFVRSVETVSRYFKEVLCAIGELRDDMIKPPSNETNLKIRTSSRWFPYFKDCVGAIDGTHVHARVPTKIAAAFRGRKHYTTQNVLAAVDFDLKFTYVLAGWEGSAHDALIFADALEREDGLRVAPVDAGYACRLGFLPPYRGTRYHLKEYGGRNYPTNPRELFNLRHSSLRVSIERAFGALKNRFRILDNKPFHPYKTQMMAEEVPLVVGDEVEVVAVAAQPQRGVMRWTNVMSGFVLRRMCQLISSGVRTDKGFKEVHLNQVAKDLKEFTGNEVTGVQVYNHLRKWRQRWVTVTKLRELSGAHWDEDNFMIVLEQEHYNGHVKAHPKDADFLNKPIENYQQMMTIFGSGMATGKFAMGSNEPLGRPSEFVDSVAKVITEVDLFDEKKATKIVNEAAKAHGESSNTSAGSKRKRPCLSEVVETAVLTNITEAVNNVAEAIRETKQEEVHPELYASVMFMPGFTEEALMVAFSHLVDNKAQGIAFVSMSESHRVLWLRTFLS